MLNTLYEPFRHWSEKGTIYIYSDPHFSDEEMVHIRKNYIGDDEQIKRINSKVGKNDTIIFLGDIGNIEIIKQIRGYKVLVMGNHDSGATNYKRVIGPANLYVSLDAAREARDRGEINVIKTNHPLGYIGYKDNHLFDEVYEGPLFISEKILLSHEPIQLPFAFNIHGHDHSNWSKSEKGFYHLNVCAEHIDYTPVNFTSLLKNGIASKVDSIHRATIDNATERKRKHERSAAKKSHDNITFSQKSKLKCEYAGRLCEHATITGSCNNAAAMCKPKESNGYI